jgi:hypothetical protein
MPDHIIGRPIPVPVHIQDTDGTILHTYPDVETAICEEIFTPLCDDGAPQETITFTYRDGALTVTIVTTVTTCATCGYGHTTATSCPACVVR